MRGRTPGPPTVCSNDRLYIAFINRHLTLRQNLGPRLKCSNAIRKVKFAVWNVSQNCFESLSMFIKETPSCHSPLFFLRTLLHRTCNGQRQTPCFMQMTFPKRLTADLTSSNNNHGLQLFLNKTEFLMADLNGTAITITASISDQRYQPMLNCPMKLRQTSAQDE